MQDSMGSEPAAPAVVDRATFQAEMDMLRVREKAHTREADAIAAARRRLPMVEVDAATPLIDAHQSYAAGCVRGPTYADRLLFHVAHRASCPGAVRGMHLVYIAGPRV